MKFTIQLLCVLLSCASCSAGKKDSKATPSIAGKWKKYDVGHVDFKNKSPEAEGAKIYMEQIPDPQKYISDCAREVLSTLYFSPKDSIPGIETIHYTIREYDGISAKGGTPPEIGIEYSTKWIEKAFKEGGTDKFNYETKGVLYHELTHAFQLEPQGIGSYGTNKTFWAMIEGVADAVRYLNGGFTLNDRPKGGNYMDGYRTTGFFLAWLSQTKDKDFLRKFNRSTLNVVPWSFNGGIQYALGEKYNIDELWKEYMTAMGD